MNNILHPGHINTIFEKVILKVNNWLIGKNVHLIEFEEEVVRARILQRLVELSHLSFTKLIIKQPEKSFSLDENKIFKLEKLKINGTTGAIDFSNTLLIRLFFEYFYEWGHAFWAIFLGFFKKLSPASSATLLFGAEWNTIKFQNSDDRFYHFCKKGVIYPLSTAKNIIIQESAPIQSLHNDIVYAKVPILELSKHLDLNFSERSNLLFKHLLNPFIFFYKVLQTPVTLLIGRDLALLPLVKVLNAKNLIEAVLITTSSLTYQPLWMREFKSKNYKTHMIHYAQNTKPFIYKSDLLDSRPPILSTCRVDEHWVWTSGYGKYLKELGIGGEVHIVGPIMFYLAESLPKTLSPNNSLRVAVFDITPLRPDLEESYGLIKYYYNSINMLNFLDSIIMNFKELEKAFGEKIEIELKHKRGFATVHDFNYIKKVKTLVENKEIKIIDYDANLFSTMSGCALVICVPFTTAAYVASSMNIPCLFYDCTGELTPSFEAATDVKMASDSISLKIESEKILKAFRIKNKVR